MTTGFSAEANQRIAWTAVVAAAILFLLSDDWLPPASIGVLWIMWRVLPDDSGPPILAIAMSYQWIQVTVGMLYAAVTGRQLMPMLQIDYHPIVTMSLVCLLAITAGLWLGRRLLLGDNHHNRSGQPKPNLAFSWTMLLMSYAAMTAIEGAARTFAFSNPSLTQPVLALTTIRLIVLYVLFRRLASPEFDWLKMGGLVLFELVLNSTGYFASFREPIIFAIIAIAEVFDWNRRRHVVTVAVLAVALAFTSLVWMNIRAQFRSEIDRRESFDRSDRLDMITDLAVGWWKGDGVHSRADDVDFLIERVWAVYYPGLALQRVPSVVPHAHGELLRTALLHTVQPRIFFPDKPELTSDSELVRRYSGVYVAGREQNTSIAFGYVPEAYVDFGMPLMLLPMLAFGVAIGLIYAWFQRSLRFAEFRIPTAVVIFWFSLYLYERSWANMLGFSLTLFVYIGVFALLLDRTLLIKFEVPLDAAAGGAIADTPA